MMKRILWVALVVVGGCTDAVVEEAPRGPGGGADAGADGTGSDAGAQDAADGTPADDTGVAPDGADAGGDVQGGDVPGGDVPEGDVPEGDVPEPACVETEVWFQEQVWEPLMEQQCAVCHTAGGPAGETRMVLVGPEAGDDWIVRDLAAIRAVALDEVDGLPVLLARPTGRHPDGHGGGSLVAVDSPAYDALARLVARLRGDLDDCGRGDLPTWGPGACDDVAPVGDRVLRRLTHTEYAATMRDLLGFDVDPERLAPDDSGLHGASADIEVVGLLADQYRELAEEASRGMNLVPWLSCSLSEGSSACAADFIAGFGGRAFRRPLSHDEIRSYLGLYVSIAVEDGFDEGLRWAVAAMLQSPNFLYRAELGRRAEGQRFELTSFEIASELSYGIWGSLPDDALWEAARTGALYESDEVEAQAQRMLADPRATERARHFVQLWLGLDRLDTVVRDDLVYPELTRELREDMNEETRRFVGAIWDEGGNLTDLLTRRVGYVNADLAAHYGIPAPGAVDEAGFGEVDLTGTPYGGILTHGSMMTTHALPTNSSPIHRGIFVREEFLCQPLPPPPSNLDTSPPPVDPTLSTRERYAQHTADPACSGCHDLIDSIGYGFEHFDGIGRYRDLDGVHPVDAQGAIFHSEGADGEFDGVHELAAQLAEADVVSACYVNKWAQLTFGVDTEGGDAVCRVEAARERFLAGDRGVQDVLVGLLSEEHVQWRVGGPEELDAPGTEVLPLPGGGPFVPEPFDAGEEPNLPDPGAEREVSHTVAINSAWDAGYCADVTVQNISEADVTWSIVVLIEGTITSAWNVVRDGDSGNVVFSGVDWNATLAPGGSAQFGFCAAR